MIKTYVGKRDKNGNAIVHVIQSDGDSHELPLRRDLLSYCGSFDWGDCGAGSAQLALALLADALENDFQAETYHGQFQRLVVAIMPRAGWRLTANEICRATVIIAIVKQKV